MIFGEAKTSLNTLPLYFDGRRYRLGGIIHEDVNGIVIFLDALGLRESWKTRSTREILDNWNNVYYLFSHELRMLQGAELSAFSDTLIISVRGHERLLQRPWRFVELVCEAILKPFLESMRYDYFLRGILAIFTFLKNVDRPAVHEAATYYEKADWIGISILPSTRSVLENSWGSTDLLVEYNIPQKPPGGLTWAVNWIPYDPNSEYWDILSNEAHRYAASRDKRKWQKYKNTLDYYAAVSKLS